MRRHDTIQPRDSWKKKLKSRVSAVSFETIRQTVGYPVDLDRTFEDRLEVLLQRLKEYQSIGKQTSILFSSVDLTVECCSLEPRSKHVASLKKQIAQVRRTITKNLSNSSVNNITTNNDDSVLQRTGNDESSKLRDRKYPKQMNSIVLF